MPIPRPIPAFPNTGKTRNANLIFGVTHFKKRLVRGRYAKRITVDAGVFVAAVLEYVIAETLELAGNATRDNHKTRITPRFLQLAIRNDDEIMQLIGKATLPQGGVLPHIPIFLLAKDRKQRAAIAAQGTSYDSSQSTSMSRPSMSGKTPVKARGSIHKSTQSKGKMSRHAEDDTVESAPA